MASGNGFGYESGVNLDAMTTTNTGATAIGNSGGTGVISTAQFMHGTRSLLMEATSTSGVVYHSSTIAATDDIALHVYVRWDTLPSGTLTSQIFWLGAGSSQLCNLEVTATGELRIRDDASANAWTSTFSMTTGVWYRIEFAVHRDPTAGTLHAAIYLGNSTTPVSGGDSGVLTGKNTGASSITTVRVGVKASTGTMTSKAYLDDWDYDPTTTTFIGPYVETLATPTVVLGATVNPSTIGGTNGSQLVTWGAISGAGSYDALIADGDTPDQGDFTLVEAGVTSPYTFENLAAGTYSYGIQAKA